MFSLEALNIMDPRIIYYFNGLYYITQNLKKRKPDMDASTEEFVIIMDNIMSSEVVDYGAILNRIAKLDVVLPCIKFDIPFMYNDSSMIDRYQDFMDEVIDSDLFAKFFSPVSISDWFEDYKITLWHNIAKLPADRARAIDVVLAWEVASTAGDKMPAPFAEYLYNSLLNLKLKTEKDRTFYYRNKPILINVFDGVYDVTGLHKISGTAGLNSLDQLINMGEE